MVVGPHSNVSGVPATREAYKLLRLMTALEGRVAFDIEDIMPVEQWFTATAAGEGPAILGAAFSGALAALRDEGISIAGALTAPIVSVCTIAPNDLVTARGWIASALAMGDDRVVDQAIISNSLAVAGIDPGPARLCNYIEAIAHAAAHIHAFGR